MKEISLIEAMAFLTTNMYSSMEHFIVQWNEDGEFRECDIYKNYNTSFPWRVNGEFDRDALKAALCQFVDKIIVEK